MNTPGQIVRLSRFATCRFWGRACGKSAYSSTLSHSFDRILVAAGCHASLPDGTPEPQRNFAGSVEPSAGWGRRGGRLQGRQRHRRAPESTGFRFGFESILGAGGAVVSSLPRQRRSEDCQVPSRRLCLSLRHGAAGPEWRWAPRGSSLTLGQRLEQSNACGFRSFAGKTGSKSEPTHSVLRARRAIRETPSPRPAAFVTPRATDARSRLEAGL